MLSSSTEPKQNKKIVVSDINALAEPSKESKSSCSALLAKNQFLLAEQYNQLIVSYDQFNESKEYNKAIAVCQEALRIAKQLIQDEMLDAHLKASISRNTITLHSRIAVANFKLEKFSSAIRYSKSAYDLCVAYNFEDFNDHKWIYLLQRALIYIKTDKAVHYESAYNDLKAILEKPIKFKVEGSAFRQDEITSIKKIAIVELTRLINKLSAQKSYVELIWFATSLIQFMEYAKEKPALELYDKLITAYQESKKYPEAMAAMDQAIALSPDNSNLYLHRLIFERQQKNVETKAENLPQNNRKNDILVVCPIALEQEPPSNTKSSSLESNEINRSYSKYIAQNAVAISLLREKQIEKAVPELKATILLAEQCIENESLNVTIKRNTRIDLSFHNRHLALVSFELSDNAAAMQYINRAICYATYPGINFLTWFYLLERISMVLEMDEPSYGDVINDGWDAFLTPDFLSLTAAPIQWRTLSL